MIIKEVNPKALSLREKTGAGQEKDIASTAPSVFRSALPELISATVHSWNALTVHAASMPATP
jgi:hypothetical protein